MRRSIASLLVLLSLSWAGGQAVAASAPIAGQAHATSSVGSDAAPSASPTQNRQPGDRLGGGLVPVGQFGGTTSWLFRADGPSGVSAFGSRQPIGFHGLGFASREGGGAAYLFDSGWSGHIDVAQATWLGAASIGNCLSISPATHRGGCTTGLLTPQLINGAVGATFKNDAYSLGMQVSKTRPLASSALLPRVLPNAPAITAVNGLPFSALEDSTSVQASGRLALGDNSGIDLGAGVGRIRLLPGNLLGLDTLGQKSLSFGLDHGTVSGRIIGRVIEPESGTPGSILGPDGRWTSIDLGVTWHLPWQGSLSFGAQNLWSSGDAPAPKAGPKPDQSRIPYVQYHQDF